MIQQVKACIHTKVYNLYCFLTARKASRPKISKSVLNLGAAAGKTVINIGAAAGQTVINIGAAAGDIGSKVNPLKLAKVSAAIGWSQILLLEECCGS